MCIIRVWQADGGGIARSGASVKLPPRNQLWPILSALTRTWRRCPTASAFGLWDVLGACEREGRLDSAIRGLAIDFARTCDAQLCTEA